MGLFDLFKKKDANFYLTRAKNALEHHRWVAARDDLNEALALRNTPADLEQALKDALAEANAGIYQLNLTEAGHCQRNLNYARALECLETARLHADSPEARARVEALTAEVKQAKADASRKVDVIQPVVFSEDEDEAGPSLSPEFEAYLAGLMPDIAELYARLGNRFAEAYCAMNGGDPRPMLELLPTMEARSEEEQALLAFEHARAFLMIQQPEQALLLLDIAASIRGSEPIFLADHPSIAYLRFEAFAMQDQLENGADALREGLQARPDSQELRLTLASVLVSLKQLDEAEPLLAQSMSCNKGDPQVHLLRAQLCMERGESANAIEALENGIKSCGCGPSALPHPMLARSLADLYMSLEQQPRRVETLLSQLFRAQQGEAEWIDHFLRARYLKWQGDEEEARASIRLALADIQDPNDPRRAQLEALFAPT